MAKSDPKPLPTLSQKGINDFWGYVDKTPGKGPDGNCYEWQGGRIRRGYGVFAPRRGVHLKAHRVAFFLATGKDPYPLLVLHRCDNPPCCNAAHLWSGDSKANNDDCIHKGRGKKASGDNHGLRKHPEKAARGARNGAAKLTDDDVRDIRRKYASGRYTYPQLATAYSCKAVHIGQIIRRERWKYI